jgi:hypothetical protein
MFVEVNVKHIKDLLGNIFKKGGTPYAHLWKL